MKTNPAVRAQGSGWLYLGISETPLLEGRESYSYDLINQIVIFCELIKSKLKKAIGRFPFILTVEEGAMDSFFKE